MPYRLLKHREYDITADRLPISIQRKALWAQVLLGVRGRTPSVKGVIGHNNRWRRTPVQGNHFYLWWIPRSEGPQVAGWNPTGADDNNTILVHSIRHHDETDDPIDLGAPGDYEEIALPSLEPRYGEQHDISSYAAADQIALATIKGLPGSGKTVSLLYLVKDMAVRGDLRKILYVTYTQRLKRMAQEFFDAQGKEIAQRISLRTLSEIEGEIIGVNALGGAIPGEPFAELRDFIRWVETQNAANIGLWKRYPQTLYTELRAHLIGRTFPPTYHLPESNIETILQRAPAKNPAIYAADRDLNLQLAMLTVRLAERLQEGRFFLDQRAAYRSLEMAAVNKLPRWLGEIDALVVDEVQDLTLLQIALLGEIARARLRKTPLISKGTTQLGHPFIFTVAGDESQIVQPSGFDWGATKDLLAAQIDLWPQEFEFQHQRRAPRNLARLIDHTWNLYLHLPKQLRPSARRQSFLFGDESDSTTDAELGRILLCPPPMGRDAQMQWKALLKEMVNKPGRAIVDLSEQLLTELPGLPLADRGEEIVFLAREIKGLERGTILIHGLNEVYLRTLRLCEDGGRDTIPLYEARRIFDEIRVALSRSTDRVVLLEPVTAPVLTELEIPALAGVFAVRWEDLFEMLQTEEMSEIEVIVGMLGEVDDLLERGRWEQAYRRNRHAYELAEQANDHALQRDAQEQHIRGHLQESASWLVRQEWRKAEEINQRAGQLAADYGDPLLIAAVEDQQQEVFAGLLTVAEQHITLAGEWLQQSQYKRAHGEALAALAIIQATHKVERLALVDPILAEICLRWANQLLEESWAKGWNSAPDALVDLYTSAAQSLQRLGDADAPLVKVLAGRYRQVLRQRELAPPQIANLLESTRQLIALLAAPGAADSGFAAHWLEEIFASLGNHGQFYLSWASLASEYQRFAPYPALDDHLWELERNAHALRLNRPSAEVEQALGKFLAFTSAHSGDPAEASRVYEQLGEFALAAEFARRAGDLERSYHLLRQAKETIPEDLAVAVRAVRLLEQLEQKHHGLTVAERQTVLEALARVHTLISAPVEGADVG